MRQRTILSFILSAACMAVCTAASAAEAWKDMNSQVLQLYQAGDVDKARPVAQKALEKAETEFGRSAPETALSLNNLALIYKKQGKYDEATRLYERSLAIAEQVAGPRNEDLLVPLNNLAALYEARGEKVKADQIYERISNMGHSDTAYQIKKRARNAANA